MAIIQSTFHGTPIEFRDGNGPFQLEEGRARREVSLGLFLEYSYLTRNGEDPSLCARTVHALRFRHDAFENGADYLPLDTQMRIARVLQREIPALANRDPRRIIVDDRFLNRVFCRESYFLRTVNNERAFSITRGFAAIGLLFEAVARAFSSPVYSMGLSLYARHNPDDAAVRRFRFDLNNAKPLRTLTKKLFGLFGGY